MRIPGRTALEGPAASLFVFGCGSSAGKSRVGVAFEMLQTEYWATSFDAIRSELQKRGIDMLEAVADGDANRSLTRSTASSPAAWMGSSASRRSPGCA